jgi:hypothetical protein
MNGKMCGGMGIWEERNESEKRQGRVVEEEMKRRRKNLGGRMYKKKICG